MKFYLLAMGLVLSVAGAHASQGKLLTDSQQRTMYTFDNDTQPGVSTCYNGCAHAWPAVGDESLLKRNDTKLIARKDGTKQITYDGKPLYYYFGDQKPGDTTGDGLGGVWHVVRDDDLK